MESSDWRTSATVVLCCCMCFKQPYSGTYLTVEKMNGRVNNSAPSRTTLATMNGVVQVGRFWPDLQLLANISIDTGFIHERSVLLD